MGSAPARLPISLAALREVYWAAGRNDLLHSHLSESLAAADPDGRSGDPDVGRMLLMKALVQLNTNEYEKAFKAASRAYAIFVAAMGDRHRDSAVALVTMGLAQRRLTQWREAERSLCSAIEILDECGDEGIHLTLALGVLGDTIARQDRPDDADAVVERAQQVLKARPMKDGLTSLRELTGGPPPEAIVRINTYSVK
jgi:tetratricopeptide (TPR) repeat protein